MLTESRACACCGAEFAPKSRTQIYCCNTCCKAIARERKGGQNAKNRRMDAYDIDAYYNARGVDYGQ